MRNTFLVTYDISNDLRLRKVHKAMRGFGDHLQYSVFECQFTPTDLVRCRHALSKLIHHKDDQVLFVDLGPVEGRGDRVITALGRPYSPIDSPCIVVDGFTGNAQSRVGKAREERAARHAAEAEDES
ncbi:MAG: CRISPR-associated endonuclease Cas2 [Vicinamibacterales bacterium]